MSRTNRPPMGLARIQRYMKGQESKIAVVVSTVTDDVRLDGHAYPGMKIAALRFTEGARARITKAGGECLTFDQLALLRPRGENTVLLRGRRNARVATRYFGTPGASGSTTRPRIESKGRKVCRADDTRSWHAQGLLSMHGLPWTAVNNRCSLVRSHLPAICPRRALTLWHLRYFFALRSAVREGARPPQVQGLQGLSDAAVSSLAVQRRGHLLRVLQAA
jgi:ribosomal protein L18E